MTYTQRETTPYSDHDNSDIEMNIGCMTPSQYASGMSEEALPLMNEFDRLWKDLDSQLQWPVQDDELRYGGYTGHRVVTFEGGMGRVALGFQIEWSGSDDNRSIVATRRKIYADNKRRHHHYSEEKKFSVEDIVYGHASDKTIFRLSVIASWLDKFNNAEQ